MLDFFLQRSLKSELKQNNRKHSFLNFEGIHNILVLFDIQDWEKISPIIKDLERNGKNVILWTIKPKATEEQTLTPKLPKNVNIIDLKIDLDWKRMIKKEKIIQFDILKYDTFLDLSVEPNDYSKLLLLSNKSNFCLGFKDNGDKLYDFVILKEEEQSLFEAYEQLKIYLEHIK